jgi:hypothetical protein
MRRKLLFLLGFVGLGGAAWLVLPEEFDPALVWTGLGEAHPGWIAASVGATFLGYAVRALRWQSLLGPLKRVGFAPLMSATVVGFGAIFTLGRPGEAVRPIWINRREAIPVVGAAATIVVERIFDLMMILVLFLIGAVWIELPERTEMVLGGLGTPLQLAVFVAAALLGSFLLHRYADRLIRLAPLKVLRSLMQTLTWGLAATSTARGFALVTLYSLLLWVVHTLQFWLMLEALDLSFPLAASIMTLVLTSLGSVAQVPGIGGGFQAGFILSATAILGMPAEVAIAASLVVWLITMGPTVIAAAAYLLWKGISVRDLRAGEAGFGQPAS